MTRPLRVAVVSRAVYPLHGLGGLERSVYDLVRHLAARGIQITLITRPAESATKPRADVARRRGRPIRALSHVPLRRPARDDDPRSRHRVPAVRRTRRAGCVGPRDLGGRRPGPRLRRQRPGVRPSPVRRATVPLVLNPQGLEEFGGSDPSRARLKRAAYLPLRRAVLACARAADCVIATDRASSRLCVPISNSTPERVCVSRTRSTFAELDATGHRGRRRVDARPRQKIPAADTVLLSVGRLEQNKGFHVLAAALGGAPRPCAERSAEGRWRWVVVGDGPFRARSRRRSRVPGSAIASSSPGACPIGNCTRGTRRPISSCIPRCTKAVRSSRSRRWPTAARWWPPRQEGSPIKSGPASTAGLFAGRCVSACRRDQRRTRTAGAAACLWPGGTRDRRARIFVDLRRKPDDRAVRKAPRQDTGDIATGAPPNDFTRKD